jgi:hypothetical protein
MAVCFFTLRYYAYSTSTYLFDIIIVLPSTLGGTANAYTNTDTNQGNQVLRKGSIMLRSTKLGATTKKAVNIMMIGMVLAGVIVFAVMGKTNTDGDLMSKLFLTFFGVIITFQIIPGIILFSVMVKGLLKAGSKETETVKVIK